MQLRNQLNMYQVDEDEMEEELKQTITGQTVTDIVLPNIRESKKYGGPAGFKRQITNQMLMSSMQSSQVMMKTPTINKNQRQSFFAVDETVDDHIEEPSFESRLGKKDLDASQ